MEIGSINNGEEKYPMTYRRCDIYGIIFLKIVEILV